MHLIWEEVLGLNRARHLSLTGGRFTAREAQAWGVVAEIHSLAEVLPRAEALAEELAAKPELYTRFISVTMRQRLSRRIMEGIRLGLALEGRAASAARNS